MPSIRTYVLISQDETGDLVHAGCEWPARVQRAVLLEGNDAVIEFVEPERSLPFSVIYDRLDLAASPRRPHHQRQALVDCGMLFSAGRQAQFTRYRKPVQHALVVLPTTGVE